MERYYQFKLLKNILDSWRHLNLTNSSQRRSRLHLRAALSARPSLARPLYALRNLPLYQAFSLFKLGVSAARRHRELEGYSSYAFYLRVLRRGFEGLRVAAVKGQRKRGVAAVGAMIVVRRWFAGLREAARVRKWARQARVESAIFNFLSIQRKGFGSLVVWAQTRRQERLKMLLATDIYAKSLIIKAVTAFR